jgi:hypothetical protein
MNSSDGLLAFGVFDVSVVLFTGPEKLLPVLNCTERRLRLRHTKQYVSAADWFHRTDPTSRAKFDKPQDAPSSSMSIAVASLILGKASAAMAPKRQCNREQDCSALRPERQLYSLNY